MRVGLFADKLNVDRGGSNFSLDLLARELTGRDHEVSIVTVNFAHSNALPDTYPYEVIEAPIRNRTRVGDANEIYHILGEHERDFDIFHIFNPALLPIAGWFRDNHDVPVVGRLNNYDIFCTNLTMMDGECHDNCTIARKFAHSTESFATDILNVPKYAFDTAVLPSAMSKVDRLFALSPAVRSVYEGIGVDPDRFAVVPNFYDPSFSEYEPNTHPFSADRSVLYVGNLRSHKGVELLVESAVGLPADVGIEIVGTGPVRDRLERLALERNVEDVVTFHGWVDHDELPAYYDAADVFVHPGHWPEPFNRTLLEAMQYDCALVVSDIGAPPWVVGDCGLTFERGDANGLRAALDALLTNEDRRKALQRNCSRRLEEFSPERVVSEIESQYDSLQ